MCGIVGLISPKGVDKYTLSKMVSLLNHRGPDNSEIWINKNNTVGLGHSRLSILDLSSNGNQPMYSFDKKFIITFNGEIYNHLKLRKEINDDFNNSIKWNSGTDTETLINYYSLYGINKTLNNLKGMFAFAICHIESNKLILARDRIGEKPLYYGVNNNIFFFASELKSIKKNKLSDLTLNHNSISEYLKYGNVPSDKCIYNNFNKLLPGHFCEIDSNNINAFKNTSYWNYSDRYSELNLDNKKISYEDAINKTKKILTDAIKSQLMSDVPIGTFLSGGIDSSLITAIANEISSNPINTFSIGYEEKQYDESVHAEKISNILRTNHYKQIVTSKNLLDVIPNISDIYDEPFADSSQIPTYLLCKLAKMKVSVCMSGDGADELFGGYNRYKRADIFNKSSKFNTKILSFFFKNISPEKFSYIYEKLGFVLPKRYQSALPKEHYYKLSKIFSLSDKFEIYKNLISHSSLQNNFLNTEFNDDLLKSYWTNNQNYKTFEDQMMAIDSQFYLPNDILTKVDRAAMSNSLETRCPYLDKDLIEFTMTLPIDMKIGKNKSGKIILKKLLSEYIPEKLIDRPKMGFGVPIDMWLKGPLKKWAEDILFSNQLKNDGIFNYKLIENSWKNYLNNQGNLHHQLWNILIFQSWLSSQ